MIRAINYFDPQIYERMAQIKANAALQKGNIGANQAQQDAQIFSTLIQQLAQLGTKAYQTGQANDYFAPKDYTVGDQRPIGGEQVVRTDLLGKPITPTLIPQYQERGTFNPMTDPQRLMQGMVSPNEEIARRSQIGIQNLLMQQPKMFEQSPGSIATDVNRFSPSFGQQSVAPFKPVMTKTDEKKLPTGFAQITEPATKAQIWNDIYGGNLTAEDFKQIQERPYYQPVTDRDGKIHIFDSRTGTFVKNPNDIIKPAPTEVRQQVVAFNDNLNTVKEIKKITDMGDLTGIVKGRVRKIGTKFYSDAEAQKLTNRLAQLRTIIYGLSGKQINESEQKWLDEEILPQMRQPTENFETTLNEFQRWIERRKGALINQFPNVKDTQPASSVPSNIPTNEEIDNMTAEQLKQFLAQ